jgi:hypothetical protein
MSRVAFVMCDPGLCGRWLVIMQDPIARSAEVLDFKTPMF